MDLIRDTFLKYANALNDHKIDEALSFFADDFIVTDANETFRIDTKQSLRDAYGWDLAANGHYVFDNITITGDVLHARMTESNDFLKLIGVKHLVLRSTYTFLNDLIVRHVFEVLPENRSWQEKLGKAVDWAKENRSKEIEPLFKDGNMLFNGETAKAWVEILKDWHT